MKYEGFCVKKRFWPVGNKQLKAHTLIQIHSSFNFYNYFHVPHGPPTPTELINTDSDHLPICSVTLAQLIPAGWFDKSAQEQSLKAKWSHKKLFFNQFPIKNSFLSVGPLVIESRWRKWGLEMRADPSGTIHFHINELVNAHLIFGIHYW